MSTWRNFAIALAAQLLSQSAGEAQEPEATEVYTSAFDKNIEIDRWSNPLSGKTPNGRRFLGDFQNHDTLYQKLSDLPQHQYVRLRFDLFVIGSWDGYQDPDNPDTFSLSVDDGPLLLTTLFCNKRRLIGPAGNGAPQPGLQSFPDEFPHLAHKAATGASAEGPKLGFKFPGKDMEVESNCYEIDVIFPHTGKDLTLIYSGYLRDGRKDESWGIDKVIIDTIDRATPQTDEQLGALWSQIQGEEPTAANAAVWKVIAAGPAAAVKIEKLWQASRDGKAPQPAEAKVDPALLKRFEAIVKGLADDSFVTRQTAQKELRELGSDSLGLIAARMESTEDPQLKRVLKASHAKLRKRIHTIDPALQKKVVASRVSHIRRIYETFQNAYKITSSVDGKQEFPKHPRGAAADGFFPESSSTDEVPRFRWDPNRRGKQWLQYEFPKPKTIAQAEVFWILPFKPLLPTSWHIEYRSADGSWKAVEHHGKYPTEPHKMNKITFKAVETDAVRLHAEHPDDTTAGVLEFRVSEGEKK